MNAVEGVETRAMHEVSHAYIFHRHFNGAVKEVAVTDDSGYCKLIDQWEETPDDEKIAHLVKREALLQLAIGSCAGKYGTARCNGGRKDYGWRSSEDRAKALQYCLALSDGDEIAAELLLQYVMRRAELDVESGWPSICKLGFALLEKGKLTGQQIREVLA